MNDENHEAANSPLDPLVSASGLDGAIKRIQDGHAAAVHPKALTKQTVPSGFHLFSYPDGSVGHVTLPREPAKFTFSSLGDLARSAKSPPMFVDPEADGSPVIFIDIDTDGIKSAVEYASEKRTDKGHLSADFTASAKFILSMVDDSSNLLEVRTLVRALRTTLRSSLPENERVAILEELKYVTDSTSSRVTAGASRGTDNFGATVDSTASAGGLEEIVEFSLKAVRGTEIENRRTVRVILDPEPGSGGKIRFRPFEEDIDLLLEDTLAEAVSVIDSVLGESSNVTVYRGSF